MARRIERHGAMGALPVLNVGSLREFIRSPDMVAFADWVADRRQPEYLALPPAGLNGGAGASADAWRT